MVLQNEDEDTWVILYKFMESVQIHGTREEAKSATPAFALDVLNHYGSLVQDLIDEAPDKQAAS
ncbi:hypothetical protein [Neptuniibacter sp. QD37_11]|uniref:hypothetical protein n=1 Tax=Neptuniibacter sp. QD37_11 TaxID=3398209 RepID=UPI0039F4DA1C